MKANSPESAQYFSRLAERIRATPRGARGALIDEAAKFLGWSKSRVYDGLKKAGWESGRKRRGDRGRRKVTEEEIRVVAGMVHESRRTNGKKMMPMKTALEIARSNGEIRRDISLSTLQRGMADLSLHPSQLAKPEPHITMRSLHPNHVWQFDVSVCVLYYLDQGGLAVMDEKRFYKNKPENLKRVAKQRVLRYLATDHYSGAFHLRYYLASGETQEVLFNFLVDAFTGGDNAQYPFRGVPLLLIWDAGSANQAFLVKKFPDRLDVKHLAHEPGNPRAKGQVESMHNVIERQFESRLFMMQVRDIDHLNALAADWMTWFNATAIHSRHGKTRYSLWQTIREDQLRLCPPRAVCQELLHTEPETRQVNGNLAVRYTVKGYEPAEYSVRHIPGLRVGDKVQVCVNPYHAPSIYVLDEDEHGNEVRWECEPVLLDAGGFPVDAPVFGEEYKAQPATPADKQRRQVAKEAYGVESKAEVDKARKKKQPAYAEIEPFADVKAAPTVSHMRRPGTELEVPGQFHVELQPLSHVEAFKRLAAQLGRRLHAEENKAVRCRFPDGVPEETLPQLVEQLRQGRALGDAVSRPASVGG